MIIFKVHCAMCIIMRNITGVICACAIYKGCGPSVRLELPPDDFSRNAPAEGVLLLYVVFYRELILLCEPLGKVISVSL